MRIQAVLASLFSLNAVLSIKVKVGHIGAIGSMQNGEKILEISRKELWKEGVLADDFDVEIISAMGCGEAYEGVAVGADMYHVQGVRAFIGPYCNAELDAVAKMATFWNVPIIGYMASSNTFADKSIYKTLARVSLRTTNSLAEAVAAMLRHFGWKKVSIVTNTGAVAFERVQSFEEVFHKRQVQVVKKIMFDENMNAKAMVDSGLMQDLKNNARIVICMFSSTRELSREFMQASIMSGINTHDFVYILPWLQSESKDQSPWIGADGLMLQNIKDHYANAIIVDDVNGFDDTIITPFKERIESNGLSTDDLEMKNLYAYIHLYDALKLYCMAARSALNDTHDEKIVQDGKFVWQKMRRMAFPGLVSYAGVASGNVLMDDISERAPLYGAFFVAPNRDHVIKVLEMEPKFITNCDGLKTKSGCYDLAMTDLVTGFWPSLDGKLPRDEPICGYRNERCDYTLLIFGGIFVMLLLLTMIAGAILVRVCQNRALAKTSWRLYRDDFRIVNEDEMKSMLSIGSTRTKLSNMSVFAKHHAIVGTNTHASFHMYPQKRPIVFNRQDQVLLSLMKQAVHDNINPFLGMSFNEKEEMIILWKFCSRGTIQDIIYNEEVTMDNKFHSAFIRDITLGLEYLHASTIGYHGSLTPWSCLIDRNWMVKLTDFGIANALERWEKQGSVAMETLKESNDKSAAAQRTTKYFVCNRTGLFANSLSDISSLNVHFSCVLYCAPEMLKNREVNRRRGLEQTWVKQSQNRRQAADIYAFGMVMYEILYRSLPFQQATNIQELCDFVRDGSKVYRPSIQDKTDMHPDLCALLLDCWNENPEVRPSVRRVRLNTEIYLKVKGSLVDQMMRMMEQYANNLEKVVKERTGMLEDANKKADRLLSQLLPKYVANELKLGRSVPPKLFLNATVMFSDIVGFTTLCSTSTPLEVVSMLNGLYSGFDDIINKNEAYKVETIGDAYMVVSGIPEENGNRHICNICDTALGIMDMLRHYEIPHRRNQRIRLRLGIHSGSVAAGVVGQTAPRYCLFGDTVNMASQMESLGMPEMIQISEVAYEMIQKFYPEFNCTPRGTVDVKGKGPCPTFWLEGKRIQENANEAEATRLQMEGIGF